MKKSLLATICIAISLSASAETVYPISYANMKERSSTNGKIRVSNYNFKANVPSTITTISHITVVHDGYGCRNFAANIHVMVGDRQYSQSYNGDICPGTSIMNIKTPITDSFPTGNYPIVATVNWSVLGKNKSHTANANLNVSE